MFLSGDNQPGAFGTTYKTDYIEYDDKMCKLRQYLNARGMKHLVI